MNVCFIDCIVREDYHIMGPLSFDILAEDYGSVNVCFNISLVEDEILEADETIHLQLTTRNSFITFNPVSATFTIQDSVREYYIVISYYVYICDLFINAE